LVVSSDLGSDYFGSVGSSPTLGTNNIIINIKIFGLLINVKYL
jgi:hypothetical protein